MKEKISYTSDKWYTKLVLSGEVGSEIFSLLFRGTLKKETKEIKIMKLANIAIFGNRYIAGQYLLSHQQFSTFVLYNTLQALYSNTIAQISQ